MPLNQWTKFSYHGSHCCCSEYTGKIYHSSQCRSPYNRQIEASAFSVLMRCSLATVTSGCKNVENFQQQAYLWIDSSVFCLYFNSAILEHPLFSKKQKHVEHPVFSKTTKACGISYVQQKHKSMWNILCSVIKQKYVEHPMCNKKSTWNILYKQKLIEHPMFSKKFKSMWNILYSAKNPKAHGISYVQQKNKSLWNIPCETKNKSTWNILCKQKHMEHPISSKKQKHIEHPMFSKKQSTWNILCWTKAYGTSHIL